MRAKGNITMRIHQIYDWLPWLMRLAAVSLTLALLAGCWQDNTNVEILTRPPAQVLVDGQSAGQAPLRLSLAPGNHRLIARLSGYEDQIRDISITSTAPLFQLNIVLPRDLSAASLLSKVCYFPVLSPDNEWLICDSNDGLLFEAKGLWINKVGEENWVPLVLGNEYPLIPGHEPQPDVRWSPDSTMLAINFFWGPIWLVHAEHWQDRQILYQDTKPGGHGVIRWSPDSQVMAVTELEPDMAVSLLHLDGVVQGLLTNSTMNLEPFLLSESGPAWSPDGKRIAYLNRSDYGAPPRTQLWTVDVATRERQLLLDVNEKLAYPVWSPNGQLIALQESTVKLALFDLQTKKLTTVLEANGNSPSYNWAPTSDRLVARTVDGLYIISVPTAAVEHISDKSTFVVRWTGDGTRLIVMDNTAEGRTIKLLPVNP
jgi:Tol biopolymer transport system component